LYPSKGPVQGRYVAGGDEVDVRFMGVIFQKQDIVSGLMIEKVPRGADPMNS